MDKEELEKKIKNKEEVYIVNFDYICETKEEAQHYIDNANVKREEKLPFVTWRVFTTVKDIKFFDSKGNKFTLKIDYNSEKKTDMITLWLKVYDEEFIDIYNEEIETMECTEENFYKMYDLCRQYFLGEKNIVDD